MIERARGGRSLQELAGRQLAAEPAGHTLQTTALVHEAYLRLAGPDPMPGPMPTRVRALPDRAASEITFPRLVGYRYELPTERLVANIFYDFFETL